MSEFSPGKVAELLRIIQPEKLPEIPESSRITVHAAVSRFAFLYEKIRTVVDYKDDHLLKKAAISRILKRQLLLESQPEKMASQLIRELIAARYLPNGVLPESLITETALVIERYLLIRKQKVGTERHYQWLLGVIAAELEELLTDHRIHKSFVNFLYEQVADKIQVKGMEMDERERRLQIYIACLRNMSKADEEMLSYKLVRVYHQAWLDPAEWRDHPRDMALQMMGVEASIKAQLAHRLQNKFQVVIKPWSVALGILREILTEDTSKAADYFEKPETLKAAMTKAAEARMAMARARLRRGTVRAMMYLFVTKILIALAIELPFENYFFGTIHLASLITNISFPPVLMFLVGRLIHLPGKENVARLQKALEELLQPDGVPVNEVRASKVRRGFERFMYWLAYVFMFLVSFGLIAFLLSLLHFTWVSALVFLFFLSVVSFFGFRLRTSAREFVVVQPVPKLSTAIIDFFSLPILRAGRWFSEKISRINIFIFIFDFIIETPFKLFLDVLESYLAFVKEKKDEMQ